MKITLHAVRIGLCALALSVNVAAQAQAPVITSFSENGVLVCSNLVLGSMATVEWASSLSGPWQTNWAGLEAVMVNSNGTIAVSVPMFYRVSLRPSGMALIPAGSFTMGNSIGDSDFTGANPTNVYTSAFYMDTNLVSYSQWLTVYNWATSHGYGFDNAGAGKAANHPVQTVNWYDVMKWSNARSQQAGLTPVYYTDAGLTRIYTNGDTDAVYANWTNGAYRLPTEAEWEKAARGGLSGLRFPLGNTISETQANYLGTNIYSYDLGPNGYNAAFTNGVTPYTSPVGYFAPNGYGLYDMAGNALEWCWDWYGEPYGQPTTTNPTGPATGVVRVLRGGAWANYAHNARCASHGGGTPSYAATGYGFRCVRGL